jgi:hypothetical protein
LLKIPGRKVSGGCPHNTGNMNWCFRVTCPINSELFFKEMIRIVTRALDISEQLELKKALWNPSDFALDHGLDNCTSMRHKRQYSSSNPENCSEKFSCPPNQPPHNVPQQVEVQVSEIYDQGICDVPWSVPEVRNTILNAFKAARESN